MPKLILRFSACIFLCLSTTCPVFAIEFDDIDIPYEEFILDNGLRVIVHTDRKAPIIAMTTWYHVGSKDEPEGKTGFAHLFEHLMFQGSENYNDEYFKPLSEIGATAINGTTNFDRTNYFQTVPTGALERMLWLESDRMSHLLGVIDQARLDEQRNVVKNEKRQRENQPFGKTWNQAFRGVFPPGHPYRNPVIGSMEDLDAATLDDVHDWFKTYYGASNVVIALSGDIDAATARPLMKKYYGDAPAGQPLTRLNQWIPRLTEVRRDTTYDRAASGFIRRFWPVPSTVRESTGLALWGSALATGRTAPLYKALVEEHRLATSVNSYPMDNEIAGVFVVSVQLLPDADIDKARRVLDETMAQFLVSGPDPERLERQQIKSLTSIVRGYESVFAKANALISGAVYANNPERFKEPIAAVQEATSESLSALANEWLTRPYYELNGLPFPVQASDDMSSAGADRSILPDVAPPAQLRFPEIEERTLENGIQIVLARREGLPVTDLNFQFKVGSSGETLDNQGITRIAFQELTSGTTTRDSAEISAEIERLGSNLSANSGSHSSNVSTGGLTEQLPGIVALVADLLSNPEYPANQLALRTDQWTASIQQSRTSPHDVAHIVLDEQVYGADHPYGRQMTEEAVQRIVRQSAVDFHKASILGQPLTVFASGDVTMDKLAQLLASNFANWHSKVPYSESQAVIPAIPAEEPRIFFLNKPGTEQSVILAGYPEAPTTIEPDVAKTIANDILGGNFISRVNLNLREDKGWSYGSRTDLGTDKFQPMFSLHGPVQVDKTADAVAELQRELTEYIENRPATSEEFNQARERRMRALAGQFETGRSLLNSLLTSAGLGRPWDYPVRYGEALQNVTLDEVHAAARKFIHPSRLTWVIAGDLSKFEDDVRALGIGEAIEVDVFGRPVESTGD